MMVDRDKVSLHPPREQNFLFISSTYNIHDDEKKTNAFMIIHAFILENIFFHVDNASYECCSAPCSVPL